MRRKLVAGNWKMHGGLEANRKLLDGLLSRQAMAELAEGELAEGDLAECAVLVPFPYLAQVGSALAGSRISWGAQDVSEHMSGAFTGEVAAPMLADFGCTLVTVGHSERRALHSEGSRTVGRKALSALRSGLTPIICVGESLAEREGGVTREIVGQQIAEAISVCGADGISASIVAYEPVWAIGTGKTASPEQAQEVHEFLRGILMSASAEAGQVSILYGGSVKAANAEALFAMPDVDGGLVGGASLLVGEFMDIWRAASAARH